jgi:hypothetical protein
LQYSYTLYLKNTLWSSPHRSGFAGGAHHREEFKVETGGFLLRLVNSMLLVSAVAVDGRIVFEEG